MGHAMVARVRGLPARANGQRAMTVLYDMAPFSRVTAVSRVEYFYRSLIERRQRARLLEVFEAAQTRS